MKTSVCLFSLLCLASCAGSNGSWYENDSYHGDGYYDHHHKHRDHDDKKHGHRNGKHGHHDRKHGGGHHGGGKHH
ncbi:MAG: hypothetical protein JSR93_08395 [Verrucomicrobia bacterium]|nr:hypothetical protein [Verrucomicrobiota bacterium]